MAEKDKRYYWLKLKRDFFKRHDIQIIESMPNGKDYILFYLKLLCESVDHDGNLRFSEQIPYNENMLATITNTNIDVVRSAIKIFTDLHMMDIMDDGTYYMSEVNKMLGSETYWAKRKREQNARKLNDGFEFVTVLSNEQIALPSGETRFVDEKRYGGNGKLVWERAKGKCEICGSDDNLCIHHNNGYSNELQDLGLVCRSCHRKIESGEISVGNFPTPSNESPTCPSKSIEIEKDIDKDKDKDVSKTDSNESTPTPSASVKKPTKHKHGEYQHVLLTDEEVEKLKKEYGVDKTNKAIIFLDEYIEMKGYKAKSHYLAIRKWVIDAVKEQEAKKKQQPGGRKTSFNNAPQRTYDMGAVERMMLNAQNPPRTAGEDEGIRARAEALQRSLAK